VGLSYARRVRIKSGEAELVLRTVIIRGMPAIALLGLAASTTTTTTPASRQADPAFARKLVTYPTPVAPGTIVVDPGSHFLYLVQDGGQAIRYGSASVARDLGGRVQLPFTANRNGRIGIHPPKCCSGSPSSENT
jgi:lipoprotein-anchoring transpeptidase ErfK/SrfK